ncbi:MAG: Lipoate-protein ligase A [Firmicutes bacterium]|nr:Lipoate-protein ligase A [Bacillota bacterium]
MKFIRNVSTNPYFNLALEEHLLKTFVQDDEEQIHDLGVELRGITSV